MGPSSRLLRNSKLAQSISVSEFATSLLSTWRAGSCHKHTPTIGLAVSGGVDSMALALLCAQIQQTPFSSLDSLLREEYGQDANGSLLSGNVRFQAFVVDHAVREGSDVEAQAVTRVLETQDIPTQVLKIDWAHYERPGELPNFESLARKYRFRLLGNACTDLGINTLFLAHHEDDIVETVMMRLIAGHRAVGLAGLQPSSNIPECHGLYGVHESGGIDISNSDRRHTWVASIFPPSSKRTTSLEPLQIESGGVKVERPLLHFSKERLIATCSEKGMRWFEDHTNNDPTVTTRNAIRHMYKSHNLPTAFSKPAILELSKRCREKQDAKLDAAALWLRQCFVKLDTQTASLRVRFVDLSTIASSGLDIDKKHLAALLLRRIIMLATPQEHVSLPSLMGAVERLFPECFWMQESPPPTTFTVAGLYFKLQRPVKLQIDPSPAKKPEWLIFRQPYPTSRPQPRIDFPVTLGRTSHSSWTEWCLFDGRFWIRAQNLTTGSMAIRPFCRDDLKQFVFTKSDREFHAETLNRLAHSGIAWTLPTIVVKYHDGNETALSLPTLGLVSCDVGHIVNWEVRYKKVNTDNIMF